MRKNLLFLIFVFGLLSGAQKNEGLILQKKTYTALIPLGQNIVIFRIDNEESSEGELVNVSQKEIYIKDITTNELISCPIQNISGIKSIAKSKRYQNLKTGFGRGQGIAALATIGAIAIVTLDRPEEFHYALFFAMITVPPAAIAGGVLGGLINMSSAKYEIEDVDLYKINENTWRVKVPDSSKQGFRRFYKYLIGKYHSK